MDHVIGKMYYWLQYHDEDLSLPSIEPVIYLGKNLEHFHEGKDRDEWYFQVISDITENGFILSGKGRVVDSFGEDTVDSIVPLEKLAQELISCTERQRTAKALKF